MFSSSLSQLTCASALLAFASFPSHAILTRTDFVDGSADYQRYINLANQDRFATVGGLAITVPFAASAGTNVSTCTGSLISSNVILTAAHCMFAEDPTLPGSRISVFSPGTNKFAGTFSNGASVLFGGGSTLASTYGGQADRVSIFPGYDGSYASGDLALVRISDWVGARPTNYLSLYTGSGEATIDPSFGVTIGYGFLGNGSIGSLGNNPGYQKLAGLTEVDYTASSTVLTSTFLRPSQIAARGYPSNFLQAAPAAGDSGGPLVINLAGVNTIVGTVGGGPGESPELFDVKGSGDLYGEVNYWVRTSSFASWITNESIALSGLAPTLTSGSTSEDPLVVAAKSSPGNPGVTVKSFYFLALGGSVYLDPASGSSDDFTVVSGPMVERITLAKSASNDVEVYIWDEGSGSYVNTGSTIGAGESYSFASGATRFRLVGLGGSAVTVGLDFVGTGAVELAWTSTPVPELPTQALLVIGLLGLVFLRPLRGRIDPVQP